MLKERDRKPVIMGGNSSGIRDAVLEPHRLFQRCRHSDRWAYAPSVFTKKLPRRPRPTVNGLLNNIGADYRIYAAILPLPRFLGIAADLATAITIWDTEPSACNDVLDSISPVAYGGIHPHLGRNGLARGWLRVARDRCVAPHKS